MLLRTSDLKTQKTLRTDFLSFLFATVFLQMSRAAHDHKHPIEAPGVESAPPAPGGPGGPLLTPAEKSVINPRQLQDRRCPQKGLCCQICLTDEAIVANDACLHAPTACIACAKTFDKDHCQIYCGAEFTQWRVPDSVSK